MKLKELHLQNIKSYEDESITFYDGVNFISGINGAGKSTIIESIGFALFDSKPGVLSEFVRYGAKTGVITLDFEAEDERLYRVVRKVGSVSSWVVYDGDSGQEIDLHGAQDVKPWLKNCLGLDQEQELAQLFTDVVGVSQGTFTAPFLDRPADRRQKFNRMLQVEAYNQAFLKTREVNAYLANMVNDEKIKQERLLGQIEGYELCQQKVENLLPEVTELRKKLEAEKSHLALKIEERDNLRGLRDRIQENTNQLSVLQTELKALHEQLEQCEKDVTKAEGAQAIMGKAQPGYAKYLILQGALKELDVKREKRDQLEKDQNQLLRQLKSLEGELDALAKTWTEQKTKTLAQLENYSKELSDITVKVQNARAEDEKIRAINANIQQQEEKIRLLTGAPDPIEELSNRVQNGLDKWQELKEEMSRSENKLGDWDDLEKKAQHIKKMQEELQEEKLILAALWQKTTSLQESKQQAADGLCPHLHEPCLNIQGNLQDYFAKLLQETSLEVAQAEGKVNHLEKVCQEGEEVLKELQALEVERHKLKESSTKESTYRRTFCQIYRESVQLDVAGKAKEIFQACEMLLDNLQKVGDWGVTPSLEPIQEAYQALTLAWQDYGTRFKLQGEFPLERVAELLDFLQKFLQRRTSFCLLVTGFTDQVKEKIAGVRNNHASRLSGLLVGQENLEKQLKDLEQNLQELDNKERSLEQKKETAKSMEQKIVSLKEQLGRYDQLDQQLEATKRELSSREESYRLYIKYQEEANKVSALQSKLAKLEKAINVKSFAEKAAQAKLEELVKDFSESKLEELEKAVELGIQRVGTTETYLQERIRELTGLQEDLAKMEEIKGTIQEIDKRLAKYEEIKALLGFIRDIFNRAGEKVATIYREFLAEEAGRIYREVSKENISLEWHQDYEVVLVDQTLARKRERSFRQLSGGEQMTAALAIRLALLKQLAGIKVGFFDEPTTNLDSERRSHLASVIPKVTKEFDQLFIISHDDSFDAMTDNIIELTKDSGEGTKHKLLS